MKLQFVTLLLLSVLAGAATAQDTGPTADEAADAQREAQDAESDVARDAEDAERDALEPGVPSAVLSADTRRTTRGNVVMDELDLERTEITGNQELPKVLYIVPWQKSDPGDLMGRPVNTLLDEVLEPVDRGEFARQVRYYEDLQDN